LPGCPPPSCGVQICIHSRSPRRLGGRAAPRRLDGCAGGRDAPRQLCQWLPTRRLVPGGRPPLLWDANYDTPPRSLWRLGWRAAPRRLDGCAGGRDAPAPDYPKVSHPTTRAWTPPLSWTPLPLVRRRLQHSFAKSAAAGRAGSSPAAVLSTRHLARRSQQQTSRVEPIPRFRSHKLSRVESGPVVVWGRLICSASSRAGLTSPVEPQNFGIHQQSRWRRPVCDGKCDATPLFRGPRRTK
jgi:hypothetical protein